MVKPLLIFVCCQSSNNAAGLNACLEYLIDSCSKSLERIGILFSDGRKFSFSRDYQNLRNEIANMAQSQGNDVGVTSCNFESFSDDVKLLIYSSLGPNVFVQVVVLKTREANDEPSCIPNEAELTSNGLIDLKKFVILDGNCHFDTSCTPDFINGWKLVRFPPAVGGQVDRTILDLFQVQKSSVLKFGTKECWVTFMPELWLDEGNGLEIVIEGFLQAADCFGPPVMSKHVVVADVTSAAKENGATLCAILHASFMALKQEDTTLNLVALVSFNSPSIRSTGFDGFITTYADTSKKKSNLVLRIFPPDQKPAWIGSMNQVVPAGVFEEDLVSGMQSSSFPVQTESSKFCSYNDSSCIAWLQSPNLFADAQKFVRLAKKVTPEKRGQVFTEANRIISIAKALSFPQYMVTIASLLGKEIETNPQNSALPILYELQRKFNSEAEIVST